MQSKWGGPNQAFLLDVRDNSAAEQLQPGVPRPSYIVMRRGESMFKWIQRRAPDPMRALWMLGEVCSQLAMMHDAGFVHRDIKPPNILWLQVRMFCRWTHPLFRPCYPRCRSSSQRGAIA
jgi:hypothetical protein